MTEQELKKELRHYQGMYYSLLNSITDVLEITSSVVVKDILSSAVYRTRDMLTSADRPALTEKEAADLLRQLICAMADKEIPMDTDFIDVCVNKIFELEDIEPPSKESIDAGIAKLSQMFEEAERDYYNKNK